MNIVLKVFDTDKLTVLSEKILHYLIWIQDDFKHFVLMYFHAQQLNTTFVILYRCRQVLSASRLCCHHRTSRGPQTVCNTPSHTCMSRLCCTRAPHSAQLECRLRLQWSVEGCISLLRKEIHNQLK